MAVKIKIRVENDNDWEFAWVYYGDGKYGMAVF